MPSDSFRVGRLSSMIGPSIKIAGVRTESTRSQCLTSSFHPNALERIVFQGLSFNRSAAFHTIDDLLLAENSPAQPAHYPETSFDPSKLSRERLSISKSPTRGG